MGFLLVLIWHFNLFLHWTKFQDAWIGFGWNTGVTTGLSKIGEVLRRQVLKICKNCNAPLPAGNSVPFRINSAPCGKNIDANNDWHWKTEGLLRNTWHWITESKPSVTAELSDRIQSSHKKKSQILHPCFVLVHFLK